MRKGLQGNDPFKRPDGGRWSSPGVSRQGACSTTPHILTRSMASTGCELRHRASPVQLGERARWESAWEIRLS